MTESRTNLYPSTLGFLYPKNRDSLNKSANLWLQDKQLSDGAEGLWRVHDGLYDLSAFVDIHPGGSQWLDLTKGTDITEAFEVHHLGAAAARILPKYFVRNANTKRNSPFTFREDGFYRTLKRNVKPVLKTMPPTNARLSTLFADGMMALSLSLPVLAACCSSVLVPLVLVLLVPAQIDRMSICAGIAIGMTTVIGHNYFHMKDNFRMYYFDLSMLSSRDWRISHALSHHLQTNTVADLEISLFEPIIEYLPHNKGGIFRYFLWVKLVFVWMLLIPVSYAMRWLNNVRGKSSIRAADFMPFIIPLSMLAVGYSSFWTTMQLWMWIVITSSVHFAFVGVNAAHHHPEIFHDGDATRKGKYVDWGIHQMDAIMDRTEITGSHFLVITNFGDHALHHLFPTLDHGQLTHLYPTFDRTCKEFGIKLRMNTQINMIKGQFRQLLREQPNPNSPDGGLTFQPR